VPQPTKSGPIASTPLLLSCQEIAKSYGSRNLFEGISFGIYSGDRIGLIGPNGSGKSTLLRMLVGQTPPDSGIIAPRKLLRLGYVPQDTTFPSGSTVRQTMAAIALHGDLTEGERLARTNSVLGRAGFPHDDAAVDTLSGGWKKRLAIAAELLREPDLLLMDEPTNHLDLEGILWLEKLLKSASFASLVVSHDRYFLETAASRVLEIDRAYPDGLFAVNGNYSEFLQKKEEFLHAQSKHQDALENKVRREIEWLRRGPKARATKSKARIDEAGRLMDELGDLSSRTAKRTTQIDFTGTDRRTKRLVEAEAIGKSLSGQPLFSGLSFVLAPGVRLGLLGPNGSGKTTLLRIVTGELEADSGEIRRAASVNIVYFDQNRERLDPDVPLRKALAPDGDSVIYRERAIHVAGWASRFLFRQEQLELPVGRLSGGEQARVLIARMMLAPADVLLLDEPTNDLDIPTLEVLEDSLLDFPGAVVLVTHDRYLLDRVSTVIVGLDGRGSAGVFADCEQWEAAVARGRVSDSKTSDDRRTKAAEAVAKPAKKLSYLESRELGQIEDRIAGAEEALRRAREEMQNPEGMSDARLVQARYDAMLVAQEEVDRLYARWDELASR
jgi:ABC transport system ATP-binding/permease protein